MKSEMIGVSMPREMYEIICKLAKQNELTKAAQTRIFPVRTAFSSFHTNIFIFLHSSALMAMPAELRRLKYFRL